MLMLMQTHPRIQNCFHRKCNFDDSLQRMWEDMIWECMWIDKTEIFVRSLTFPLFIFRFIHCSSISGNHFFTQPSYGNLNSILIWPHNILPRYDRRIIRKQSLADIHVSPIFEKHWHVFLHHNHRCPPQRNWI